jgi:hypothetical protein
MLGKQAWRACFVNFFAVEMSMDVFFLIFRGVMGDFEFVWLILIDFSDFGHPFQLVVSRNTIDWEVKARVFKDLKK